MKNRREFLKVALGSSAMMLMAACAPAQPQAPGEKAGAQPTEAPRQEAPATLAGASLRLWLLKTYVEPTNKAIEASAQEWAKKHNAAVTVEYFTFEDMQTKYVAAIETNSTPDIVQLETGAPIRFAGMGQLVELTQFARQVEGTIGRPFEPFRPVVITPDGKQVAIPWYSMHAFWYVWRDVLEKKNLKLPDTYEDALNVATAVTDPNNNFYGIGQAWNRTSDGYGVMQSLMYSYGASWADKEGKYRSIKTPQMQAAMAWATDIYTDDLSPPDLMGAAPGQSP